MGEKIDVVVVGARCADSGVRRDLARLWCTGRSGERLRRHPVDVYPRRQADAGNPEVGAVAA